MESIRTKYNITIIVMNKDIIKLIKIIDLILAPAHIIISGPKATFGSEFRIVKYGFITLAIKLFHQRIMATDNDIIDDIRKLIITSYIVIKTWLKNVFCFKSERIVSIILDGELYKNVLIIFNLANISHIVNKINIIII